MKKKENKFYTSYSKLSEVKLIKIGLASPEIIKLWAEKILPNGKILGEVINANTVHHKTFKPQKGGLFCERIFGPLKDFECACGKPLKYKKEFKQSKLIDIKTDSSKFKEVNIMSKELNSMESKSKSLFSETRKFCNICEVEYTWSVMRRYQLGYIKLVSPITHVWYLKGNPSYLSILLDIKKKHLEYITYCSETITLENSLKKSMNSSEPSDIVASWKKIKEQIINQKEIKKRLNDKKKNVPLTLDKKNLITSEFNTVKFASQFNVLTNGPLISEEKINQNHHFNKIKQNKIDKRKKLILKKENTYNSTCEGPWKKGSLIDLNQNQNYLKKNVKVIENLTQNDKFNSKTVYGDYANSLNFFKNEPLKRILSYKTVKLKNLKVLSFLISQSKKKGVTNLKKIKQIYKKLHIPFYILLNLNTFSQQSIYSHLIDTTWKKLIEIALKNTLNKINKIFNPLNLSETLAAKSESEAFLVNDWLLLNNDLSFSENFNEKDFKTLYSLLLKENNLVQVTNLTNLNHLKLNESSKNQFLFSSGSSHSNFLNFALIENKLLSSNKDLIFLVKTFFYNHFFSNSFKNQNEILNLNKSLVVKSHFYLELYTLSNFSNKMNHLTISDFLNKSDFHFNLVKMDHYKLIIQNLTKVFFNLLIQNFTRKMIDKIKKKIFKHEFSRFKSFNFISTQRYSE